MSGSDYISAGAADLQEAFASLSSLPEILPCDFSRAGLEVILAQEPSRGFGQHRSEAKLLQAPGDAWAPGETLHAGPRAGKHAGTGEICEPHP